MSASKRQSRATPLAMTFVAAGVVVALSAVGGCSVMDRLMPGGSKASKGETQTAAANPDAVDPRRYIGPDYCPELRIYDGAQLIRTYQRGHQGDQNFVTWQASFGKTARECLYDLEGYVTLKIGVAGRVVAGPKGESNEVNVPVKIAVVKYKESVIATERFSVPVTIPGQGSTTFTQVKELRVPSPGSNRDYVIYVGFDVGDWDPMHPGGPAVAAVDEPPVVVEEAPVEAAAPPPPPPTTPNELPVPSGGFVLSQ
jgi:hypothetical protein